MQRNINRLFAHEAFGVVFWINWAEATLARAFLCGALQPHADSP